MKPTSTKSFSSFEEARQANFEGMELPEEFYQGKIGLIVGHDNVYAFMRYLQNIGKIHHDIIEYIASLPDYLKGDDLTLFWQANILSATTVNYCITSLRKETHHIETYLFSYGCEAVLDLL